MIASLNVERGITYFCICSGFMVSCIISPKDEFFFGNLSYYWAPQGAILLSMFLLRSHFTLIAGSAIVLALYLVAFNVFVVYRGGPDPAMAWIAYLFSMPGAALGALVGIGVVELIKTRAVLASSTILALTTLVGLSINQVIVWWWI